MIITCPCGKKKFEIDAALIPDEGRKLKCGSCDEVWFYKKDDDVIENIRIQNIQSNKNFSVNNQKKNKKGLFKKNN